MTTPHLPPPGAHGSSAGPRPVPPHVQSRGPAPPVSPNTAHGMSRPVNWSAMSGNPGPVNWPPASSQVQQGQHVMPVARGPQPNSVEPTRLRNGKKIKDVERRQQQIAGAPHEHQTFSGPTKSAVLRRKEQLQLQQRDANSGKHIKTTVGNDNSWVKGLAYSTWVDSPKGTLNHLDREGPYKRQPKGNRNLRKNKRTVSRNSMGKSSLLVEALRNLFR
ncbi:conserved hypothetical protein [Leishmania braziliensis MHOM/BR/75/M2904]|uniref:Uncharacterized protein n=1 Tax=Leishmania braziliensis TaxID=5660 RepID=E9AIF3_LEIBR|nr:conserved hypothetical protein [Leishmania braziliensis MHOM/BR/75/M2904]KAI5686770.1 hypothetical protein MNV84_03422 [Leishmania braziliensis]CAJ2472013.1 unnamed protein product [Leishmania braziliensis]CBZ14597.1 conserved hypothetical protein [Leishmania braziliensis MHOM/BR/75/M2904]